MCIFEIGVFITSKYLIYQLVNSTQAQRWVVPEAQTQLPSLSSTSGRLSIYSIYWFQLSLIRLIAKVEFRPLSYFVDDICGCRFVQMN